MNHKTEKKKHPEEAILNLCGGMKRDLDKQGKDV